MTDLTTPVTRRTRGEHPRHQRRIVATLEPGDVIALRLERSRGEPFRYPLAKLYDVAERQSAMVATGMIT